MLVADFHHLLQLDLEEVFAVKSWRWFELRVNAVMAYPDSLIGAAADAKNGNDAPGPADEPPGVET